MKRQCQCFECDDVKAELEAVRMESVRRWLALRRVAVNPVPSQGVWRCEACCDRPSYGTWTAPPDAINMTENHAPDCLARIETDTIEIDLAVLSPSNPSGDK